MISTIIFEDNITMFFNFANNDHDWEWKTEVDNLWRTASSLEEAIASAKQELKEWKEEFPNGITNNHLGMMYPPLEMSEDDF